MLLPNSTRWNDPSGPDSFPAANATASELSCVSPSTVYSECISDLSSDSSFGSAVDGEELSASNGDGPGAVGLAHAGNTLPENSGHAPATTDPTDDPFDWTETLNYWNANPEGGGEPKENPFDWSHPMMDPSSSTFDIFSWPSSLSHLWGSNAQNSVQGPENNPTVSNNAENPQWPPVSNNFKNPQWPPVSNNVENPQWPPFSNNVENPQWPPVSNNVENPQWPPSPVSFSIPPLGASLSMPTQQLLTVTGIIPSIRVETGMNIKLVLNPMLSGMTWLHVRLPRHCLSSPKMQAGPEPPKSWDMLELDAMVVCATPMLSYELRQLAFKRAAERSNRDNILDRFMSEPLPNRGGEVEICPTCVKRENKRAARRKIKEGDENIEKEWRKDIPKRVIIFRNDEVETWNASSEPLQSLNNQRSLPLAHPTAAKEVRLNMRIACYCRHQDEKDGFQVIFTLKTHENVVVAQTISDRIMIVDTERGPRTPPAANALVDQPSSTSAPNRRILIPKSRKRLAEKDSDSKMNSDSVDDTAGSGL